jgi:N6-adenosine-specific RNA methylase IME4
MTDVQKLEQMFAAHEEESRMLAEYRRERFVTLESQAKALAALDALERELDSPKTYEAIRKVIKAAEAVKLLGGHIAQIKQKAEWVILIGNQRIGEELATVPKATKWDDQFTPGGKLIDGKAGTGIPGTSRSRLGKLASIARDRLRQMAESLWGSGKDATVKAIIGEKKEEEIREERASFEQRRDRGARVDDLIAMAEQGKKFKVIYADPPWEFKVYSGKGKQRSAERYYDTESLEGIKALPIKELADDDCVLFLWGVCPELPGALDVIKAWGFDYKTIGFVWVKTVSAADNPIDGEGRLSWGLGYWSRANVELVLLATKGKPQRMAKDVHQVVIEPVGQHSVKPEKVAQRIESLLNGPYLELFARRPRKGWTVWGEELEHQEAAE